MSDDVILGAQDAPVIGIMGRRGYGKTTRLRRLIAGIPRVVAWDPVVTLARPRGQLELPHRFDNGDDAAAWIRALPNPAPLRCSILGRAGDPDEFAPVVNACVESGGRMVLAIDEVSTLCKGKTPHPHLAWILDYGRHYGIPVIWTARRPQQVAMLCTSQADRFEVFRTTQGRDVKELAERFRHEDVERMPHLARHEFVTSEE